MKQVPKQYYVWVISPEEDPLWAGDLTITAFTMEEALAQARKKILGTKGEIVAISLIYEEHYQAKAGS